MRHVNFLLYTCDEAQLIWYSQIKSYCRAYTRTTKNLSELIFNRIFYLSFAYIVLILLTKLIIIKHLFICIHSDIILIIFLLLANKPQLFFTNSFRKSSYCTISCTVWATRYFSSMTISWYRRYFYVKTRLLIPTIENTHLTTIKCFWAFCK